MTEYLGIKSHGVCNFQMAPQKEKLACMTSHFSHVQLFATPWTVACQVPLSMGFSSQEYWSVLSFPSPGDLPDPGIKPKFPALQADSLVSEPPGKPQMIYTPIQTCLGRWKPGGTRRTTGWVASSQDTRAVLCSQEELWTSPSMFRKEVSP